MHYVKMHGAGNSFVLVENMNKDLNGVRLNTLARFLCDPKTGPGADGLIVLSEGNEGRDFSMLFYNSDGSLGEMCGNGARCAACYGLEHGFSRDPERICFQTTAGPVTARRIASREYQVALNLPTVIDLHRRAEAFGDEVTCAYVELGSPGLPHAVTEVMAEDLEDAFRAVSDPSLPCPLRERGRQLRKCASFPKGANVTFFAPTGENSVRAITFERGVEDFTLACGTGCGATAVTLMLSGRLTGDTLFIRMPGGDLSVCLCREGDIIRKLLLTGPVAVTEEGEIPDSTIS